MYNIIKLNVITTTMFIINRFKSNSTDRSFASVIVIYLNIILSLKQLIYKTIIKTYFNQFFIKDMFHSKKSITAITLKHDHFSSRSIETTDTQRRSGAIKLSTVRFFKL